MTNRPLYALCLGAFSIVMFLTGALRVHASVTTYPANISEPALPTENNAASAVYQIDELPAFSVIIDEQENGGQLDQSAPILKDVRAVEQGSQTLLIKTWDVPPEYDPDRLVETDFEKGGLHYKKAYLLQVSENHDNQVKLASETVTVSHESKNDVMARLQPLMDYDQGGFTGQLTLQADAIITESAGKSSYNYAVTDVRKYAGLERNDPYSIPKTVDKNGVQLRLTDISWTQMGEGNYVASVSYRGSASGETVTGYVSTATYIGEVSKNVLDSVTYAVVYEGSIIPLPPFDFSPYLIAGSGVLIVLIFAFILLNRRDNTKIYAMNGKEYQLIHKQKVTSLAPIIDLSPQDISGHSDEFMIVLDRLAVRKLRGHIIKIIGKDGMMKEHRVFKTRHFHIACGTEEEIYE